MKRCVVFAAGSYYGLRERPGDPGDFVIAADAGYRVCLEESIQPDLLVGDFDSMEPPADFARVRRLPVEKDDTDTLAALRAGAGLHGFSHLRRHRRQAAGPHPGQPPVPPLPPPPGGPGLPVRQRFPLDGH